MSAKLLENPYYLYMPQALPGDLVRLYVEDDMGVRAKIWARVMAKQVGYPPIYAGRLDQFTVLDISPKQGFVFTMWHVHYIVGASDKFWV